MFRRYGTVALVAAAWFAGGARAGDTIRLVDRPADRGDTRTLKYTPEDREASQTDQTHWRWGGGWGRGWGWGGWGRGWGGWGHGWGWGAGLSIGFHGGYHSWGHGYWGGYRPWGYGYYGWPSLYTSYAAWPYSSIGYYPSVYYAAPAYPVYTVPSVTYYYASPTVLSLDPCCPPAVASAPARVETPTPAEGSAFRYDGVPTRPIPAAKSIPQRRDAELPPIPTVPADPKVPTFGPTATERKVSLPAPGRKQFQYPAYGEGPDAPKPAAKPARELLVRGG